MSEMEDNDFEPESQNQETQETQESSTSILKNRTADIYNFFTYNTKTKKWKCNYCT
jgi:hypothetical protein